ncbi:MAG TPA: CocE/NonD family hydrolase [Saprospiraceae bacterium]|nr:CocE/NonD family hydrolase [Saprospiraceae bacterium]HMQ81960.1 CocE/NonD family hydrolase [Saprospiraceae bacterium]
MKKRLFLVLIMASTFCLATAQSNEDSLFVVSHYTKTEYRIPMRDGKHLFTAVYTPKDQSKTFPFIMMRTPYSVSPYSATEYSSRLWQYIHLAREGFIFVFQDVRGKYMSEGEFVDVRPHHPNKKSPQDVDESSDTYDTVDWLLKNVANNNGRVGIMGISYPGFYSSASLPEHHPAIKAVSPQAPVTDWFIGDDFHHNGAFFLMDAFSFYYSFGRPRPEPTTLSAPRFEPPHGDNYRFYLETGALKNFNDQYMKGEVPFWNEVMAHPDYDQWWQARNIRPHLKNIKTAVMTVGGWFDAEDSFGPLGVYRAIEQQNPGIYNILVEGPWFHGGWSRGDGANLGNAYFESATSQYYRQNIELPFFRHFLKDEGYFNLSEANIFITGTNTWQGFEQWPPKGISERKYYLQANGKLSDSAPSANSGYDEYLSDPAKPVPYTEDVHWGRTREYMTDDQRFASRRPDVLVYQTEVLEEDVTVLGPVDVGLFVSSTGTDADFVVKLIDVFPDDAAANPYSQVPMGGYQMLVRGEPFRARYRNSFEKPEALTPGKVESIAFTMPDVAHTFKKGHRIMVQVQSSWFPLVDRNPQQFINIYECSDSDFQKATQRVYHGGKQASYIELGIK